MLIDRTDESLMRLLVDATRRAQVQGAALAGAHRAVGAGLASNVAERLDLQSVPIAHATGQATGVAIESGKEPIIIAIMRGGLFLAEGIWEQLPGATLHLHQGEARNLAQLPLAHRPVVVVDSVVNSGGSLSKVLDVLNLMSPNRVMVAVIVGYRPTMNSLVLRYPEFDFIAARLSERSYTGIGGTDTGARLFGTTGWAMENQSKP